MFRAALPAILSTLPLAAPAETLRLTPDQNADQSPCIARGGDPNSCVRVLACIGTQGEWFDGRAYGWDDGTVSGTTNLGIHCEGHWSTRFSIGTSQLTCDDGRMIEMLYTNQDNATGTGIGHGRDSTGQPIQSWAGTHVLEFLTPEGAVEPRLLCGTQEILVS